MRRALLALAALALTACDSQEPAKKSEPVAAQTGPITAHPSPPAPQVAIAKPAEKLDAPAKLTKFQAFGTEPFWGLEILPGKLVYGSPEVPDGITFEARMKWEGKRRVFRGALQGKPVLLAIEPGICSDGMSDRIWRYKAEFTWGERTK
jgi:uncharacterized membrane protein